MNTETLRRFAAHNLSREDIDTLAMDAEYSGDDATVDLCARALRGDLDAIREVSAMLEPME